MRRRAENSCLLLISNTRLNVILFSTPSNQIKDNFIYRLHDYIFPAIEHCNRLQQVLFAFSICNATISHLLSAICLLIICQKKGHFIHTFSMPTLYWWFFFVQLMFFNILPHKNNIYFTVNSSATIATVSVQIK